MTDEPMLLSTDARLVVHRAIVEVCEHRVWKPLALNVRTNHVHVVLAAGAAPERAMGTFKAWSTRRLREEGFAGPDARVWSRHGSTRYLWSEETVRRAVSYVVDWQD
jgi:REP element-mobilizing transposase RayT